MSKALTTIGTYLKFKPMGAEEEFQELVEIKDYPDLGASPTKHDTTTMSALKYKTSINGLMELPEFTFTANFNLEDYEKCIALTDKYDFKLEFGQGGSDGAWTWTGELTVNPTGGEVDGVRQMTLTLSTESELVFVAPTP